MKKIKLKFEKVKHDLEEELWLPLEGYEGIEISEFGRFRSLRIPHKIQTIKVKNENTIDAEICIGKTRNESGRWNRVTNRVIDLVAKTFIPNPSGTPFVKHISENLETNLNHYKNLKWYSGSENYGYMIWKDLPTYDCFKVSEYGHVASTFYAKRKMLSTREMDRGMISIRLSANGYDHIQDLVALAFIPNPNGYSSVKHKDGNLKNNHYSNLEWVENLINDLDDLIWKDIPDFPGYKISEYGHIMSFKTKIPQKIHTNKKTYGRHTTFLTKNNIQTYFYIDELVANTFLKNPNNYKNLLHLDGDFSNSHYNNLKWSKEKEILENDGIEWKEIPMYPLYKISELGEVKSYSYGVPKILKQYKEESGYYKISLYNKYGQKKFSVYRLIAVCFIPNPENKPMVDHINRNKEDNRVSNLRWATAKENAENRDNSNSHHYKPIIQMDLEWNILKIYKSLSEAEQSINQKHDSIGKCARGELETFCGFRWCHIDDEEDPYEIQEGEIFVPTIGMYGNKEIHYPNYKISNFGNLINSQTGLKKISITNVYPAYALSHEGENKSFLAHKLVASFFVEGRTEERCIVNHKDENKKNPHYTNLEWVTQKENMIYSANRKRFNMVVKHINMLRKI